MDYKRFRVWLKEKYGAEHAYIFLGLVPKYKDLYTYLSDCGFSLIFKEVVYGSDGKAKGNCDADLVLRAVVDTYEKKFDKAVIVSSDGDYAGLVKFLIEKQKIESLISPSDSNKCSILLKRTGAKIAYLQDQMKILKRI